MSLDLTLNTHFELVFRNCRFIIICIKMAHTRHRHLKYSRNVLSLAQVKEWTSKIRKEGYQLDRQIKSMYIFQLIKTHIIFAGNAA